LLLVIALVLFAGLLLATDRTIKAIRRAGRRREADRRLSAATAAADAQQERRKAVAEASEELTSLIPTIHDHEPRHVD
jgi:hypothetical protein